MVFGLVNLGIGFLVGYRDLVILNWVCKMAYYEFFILRSLATRVWKRGF